MKNSEATIFTRIIIIFIFLFCTISAYAQEPPLLYTTRGELHKGTSSQAFTLPEKTTLLFRGIITSEAELTITSPSGKTYDKTSPAYNLVNDHDLGYFISYYINDAEAGKWQATIKTISPTTSYSLTTYAKTSYSLNVDSGKARHFKANESFPVNARFMKGNAPVTGAKIIAAFPVNTGTSSIELFDDGSHNDNAPNDGLYSNTYPGFSKAISAPIKVDAVHPDLSMSNVGLMVYVEPDTAGFGNKFSDEALNINAHPLLDIIRIGLELNVKTEGHYSVSAALCNTKGIIMGAVSGWNSMKGEPLKPGIHNISIDFETLPLNTANEAGPYKLCNVILVDLASDMPIAFGQELFTSKTYNITNFNQQPDRSLIE